MRFFIRVMIVASFLAPVVSQAALGWSNCQTVTAVTNYLPLNSSIFLTLSPGISGCSYAGVTGAVSFLVGQNGVTDANIGSLLASSLVAFTAGKQVMIYYDNSSTSCYSEVISVGGYAAQCP